MIDYVFLTLLFIHITAVVGWVGGAMIGAFVLIPVQGRLSPGTRAELGKALGPLANRFSMTMAGIALADGVLLYGYLQFLAPKSEAISTLGDPLISAGAVIGLLTLLGFVLSQRSAAKQMGAIQAQMAQSPGQAGELGQKLAGIQKRSAMVARIGVLLFFLVIILMVVGANVS